MINMTAKTNAHNILQRNNMELENMDWMENHNNEFILIHNPRYKTTNREPYKIGAVLAIICDSGNFSGIINLKPCLMGKNSFLIILPGQIIESIEVSDDFEGTYIYMTDSFLSRLQIGDSYKFYESVENEPIFHYDNQSASALRHYIEMSRTMCIMQSRNPNTGEALRLLTRVFFLMIGWFIHSDAVAKKTKARDSDVTKDYIALVRQHYREHRDVEFYADKMNMTAKYMSTLVKKASGKPAMQWIEDYVILDAKAQLSSTMNTVQQITFDLNFPTQSIFGRYFKRAVGMSPSEYRRSVRMTQGK